jgi:hypothetical protein
MAEDAPRPTSSLSPVPKFGLPGRFRPSRSSSRSGSGPGSHRLRRRRPTAQASQRDSTVTPVRCSRRSRRWEAARRPPSLDTSSPKLRPGPPRRGRPRAPSSPRAVKTRRISSQLACDRDSAPPTPRDGKPWREARPSDLPPSSPTRSPALTPLTGGRGGGPWRGSRAPCRGSPPRPRPLAPPRAAACPTGQPP